MQRALSSSLLMKMLERHDSLIKALCTTMLKSNIIRYPLLASLNRRIYSTAQNHQLTGLTILNLINIFKKCE
jgi:hypothetical protein